jgi:cytoskeletal protein CcmA (bactofilin family)
VTLIGPDTLVRGDVRSTGPVEIRGTLEGDCQTSARCIVHESGRVLGNIDAAALIVAGRVEAGVIVADKIELRASASVEGAIRARVLVIEDGALYEGNIEGPGAAGNPSLVRDRRGREPEEPPAR